MSNKEKEGFIGVDLDCTLAYYDHYRGDEHIGAPIEPMVNKVKQWIEEGKDVRLFTARKPHPAIRRWMAKHLGAVLPIVNEKSPMMVAFYDDKAIAVKPNTGEPYDDKNEQEVLDKAQK
jgi:hypothetical protein